MKIVALIVFFMTAFSTSPLMADRLIPFQARLTDASGQPVADGVYKITFRIYKDPLGGTAEVSEEMSTVSVIRGYVNVLLGAINSLDGLNFADPHYLGITVDLTGTGSIEMVPRHQLVPAFHARTAERATLADRAEEAEIAGRVHDEGVTWDALDANLKGGLVPQGTVAFFDKAACPPGWSELKKAAGRVVVGLPFKGTLKGTQGTPFSDLESRDHNHTLGSGAITGLTADDTHNHRWAHWLNNGNIWKSWNSSGNVITIVDIGNGTHTDGSGQANLRQKTDWNDRVFYTNNDIHSHGPGTLKLADDAISTAPSLVPTIQLLVCRKD